MRAWVRAGFVALLALVAGVAPALAEMTSLSGQVTYRERVALPPGASLRIVLVDLTEADRPARIDVRAPIGSPGQVPLTFALNFDERALVPEHQHGLVAEIVAGGEIWFHNVAPYELNPLSPPAALVIVTQAHDPSTGSIAPAADAQASPPSAIVGVNWRATEINGAAVGYDIDSTLSIGTDNRAGGRGGCNNYFAQAEIRGSRISFGAIASTRAACAQEAANAQETAFFEALGTVRTWQLADDGSLTLFDAENAPVVRLAPVAR